MEAINKQSKLRRDPVIIDIRIISEYATVQQVETSENQKQIKLDDTCVACDPNRNRKAVQATPTGRGHRCTSEYGQLEYPSTMGCVWERGVSHVQPELMHTSEV